MKLTDKTDISKCSPTQYVYDSDGRIISPYPIILITIALLCGFHFKAVK